jgi:hypothetical protein
MIFREVPRFAVLFVKRDAELCKQLLGCHVCEGSELKSEGRWLLVGVLTEKMSLLDFQSQMCFEDLPLHEDSLPYRDWV